MIKIALFDAKQYDIDSFEQANGANHDVKYLEHKLGAITAGAAQGFDAVVPFVNDTVDAAAIEGLLRCGVKLISLRSAGYNNVDLASAFGKIHITRVPGYSPNAVAEHAMALLLGLNRKTHRAFNRTREYNFSLNGLLGFDLSGKTAGVVGMGKIGRVFADICLGFGMKVIAYDPFSAGKLPYDFAELEDVFAQSDIISLHCPLNEETRHMINEKSLKSMKKGVVIINTSRGGLIESGALLEALRTGRAGAAGLDVYEEEADLFFEDLSDRLLRDDVLSTLISLPNVLITSHQGFFTKEALSSIAETTFANIDAFFSGKPLENEICYRCGQSERRDTCPKTLSGRCF